MQFFTQAWYHSGCHKVDAYHTHFARIAWLLPPFFREDYSLHDARIRKWSLHEPYWGRKDLCLDLDTRQSLTKVKRIVFKNCEMVATDDITSYWWIADEAFVDQGIYTLNVLLLKVDNTFCEMSIRFADFEAEPFD